MSRIRSIKPGFFSSEDLAELSLTAERTFAGLWTVCDDHGRTKDNVKLIKAAIWPLRPHSLTDVENDLVALAANGQIVRYTGDDGKPYLVIVNWHVHQKPQKPGKPKYPAPPSYVTGPVDPTDQDHCKACSGNAHGTVRESSRSATGGLTEDSGNAPVVLSPVVREVGDQVGEGTREPRATQDTVRRPGAAGLIPEPPLRCPKHINDPSSPPCGACGDARRNHDTWLRFQDEQAKARPTPIPSRPVCPLHPDAGPGSGLGDCPACKAEAAPAPSLRGLRAVAGGA